MATQIVKSVGSGGGRDYSTLALAVAALPANLVTADQQWTFELYADSEFTAGCSVTGITVDATRYIEFTAAAGQSFQDSASVRTNALRYNAANGVAIKQPTNYFVVFDLEVDYVRMSRLQIYQQGTNASVLVNGAVDINNATLADLLIETESIGGSFAAVQTASSALTNVVIYCRGNIGQGAFGRYNGGNTYRHCSAIVDSNDAPSGMAFRSNYATSIYYNCASFGFSTAAGNADAASRNCATDLASFGTGSGHVTSVSYSATTPWTNAASGGSQDLAAVAATALAAAGIDDTADALTDITGATRPATPTIGHWELTPTGGASPPSVSDVTPDSFANAATGIVADGSDFGASGNEVWLSPIDNKDGETTTSASQFGAASGGTNPTTSTTITVPSSLPAGCVLSLHFTSRDHTSGTAQPTVSDNNSGAAWTQKRFTTDRKAQWWYKRYEASLSGKTITISGAVGSLSARLVVIQNVVASGDPFEDVTEETNISGNETHAAVTPSHAGAALVLAIYDYANDDTVTSPSAATFGAADASASHLSTGGSDCATTVAVWNNRPASTSGSLTWAQVNATTYSFAYTVRPRTPAGAAIQQTVTAEGATQITVTAVQGTLVLGGAYLFVNNAGSWNASGFPVTITAAGGVTLTQLERSIRGLNRGLARGVF